MGVIKNFDSIATTPQRKVVLDLVETAFASIEPKEVLKNVIRDNNTFKIKDQVIDLNHFERIFIVGFGKGSAEVCRHLEKELDEKLNNGWDIDVLNEAAFTKIMYTKGTHPLPSQQNVKFTQNIATSLKGLTQKDLVLVITCGGGSVLLINPKLLALSEMVDVNKALLKSGATISEINTVRKHLDMIKGGGLAKLLYPATVYNLIFSDVPGNDLSVIASGPLVKDETTVEQAWEIYEKYNLRDQIHLGKSDFFETPKEDKYFSNVVNILIVSNQTALLAMQSYIKKLGLKSNIYSNKVEGNALELGKFLIENTKKGEILLAGGESTIHVTGKGKGGRNQALVLSSLPYVKDDTIIVAFDSDGWDFYELAGALGDKQTVEKAKQLSLDIKDFLDRDNSYAFWQKVSDGIVTGKLESNVSDLYIVYKK